ncbi:MAG: peptide-methionine (S)-S-oxide reductase MsrA [Arenimonas sp.]
MNSCELPGLGLSVTPDQVPDPTHDVAPAGDRGEAILAGGCFWCTEAVFRRLNGVNEVQPGYAGGAADAANYKAVCSGKTGHAEVIRIVYDSKSISYGQLLKVFFAVAHDPTQKDRQGNDVGTQYRSALFPLDEEQRAVATDYIRQLDGSGAFTSRIATTIEPLEAFFVAESYHHNYAELNPGQGYIQFVSMPKVGKLESYFPGKLKD